jgi:phosphoadenosine phosphosulfate reductase
MDINFLENIIKNNNFEENLKLLYENVNEKIVFSTSFGIEDQVITQAVFSQKLKNIEVFTLDTGRLFPETYSVWDKTLLQYGGTIKTYYPDTNQVETYVEKNGINAFYGTVDLRKECCHIRKVVPLKRALEGAKIWITGLRAEQSENRNNLKVLEWDDQFQLFKYNPLLDWTTEEVEAYLKKNGVPYNTLHDKGYVSIGCAPCTRAIQKGENFRAGRWWWEDNSKKECGLHK